MTFINSHIFNTDLWKMSMYSFRTWKRKTNQSGRTGGKNVLGADYQWEYIVELATSSDFPAPSQSVIEISQFCSTVRRNDPVSYDEVSVDIHGEQSGCGLQTLSNTRTKSLIARKLSDCTLFQIAFFFTKVSVPNCEIERDSWCTVIILYVKKFSSLYFNWQSSKMFNIKAMK